MIIVLIVFLIASIINWRIARKRQAHCWRDESSRRKNQKKTIFVVIRSNVDTTPIEAVVPVGCIFWIIYLTYYGQSMTNSMRAGVFIVNIIVFAMGCTPYAYEICFDEYTICRRIFNRRKYWNLCDIKYCKVKMKSYRMGVYPVIYVYMKGKRLPAFWVSEGQFGFMRFLRCMKFIGKKKGQKPGHPRVPLIGKEKLDDYFLRSDI